MDFSNNRLSLAEIERAQGVIDPVFLNTPQYFSESLEALLKSKIILKVETQNPIGSFKGRGSDFLVSQIKDSSPIMCASAGNFGQAMAYSCSKKGIKLTVFASTEANPYKLERMKSLGAKVVLFGDDFDTAKIEAKRVAETYGTRFIEDSQDIETLAGAGTIGLELLKFENQMDYLLIALGNGALFNGVARVIRERSPATKIVVVQALGASAMIDSWKEGKIINYHKVETIAEGIAVRVPIPQALQDMQGLVDEAILVEESSILKAMQLLYKYEGLITEPSAAVGIAAILENREKFISKTGATILCGGNLTEEQKKQWIYRQ